jgi:hypothetical protein
MQTETFAAPEIGTVAPTVTTCGDCGAAVAPSGDCLEVGTCRGADAAASRSSSSGATSKYAVPAAWNAGGRVD